MSLAQVTKETRVILKFGGAAIALAIFIFLIFKGGVLLQNMFFPKPPPSAELGFGKIQSIVFPEQNGPLQKYEVNTVSGKLPGFSPTIRVYKLLTPQQSITSLQNARTRAAGLGYTQNQQALSTEEYRWSRATQNNTLLYNIVNLNFSVSSDYLVNPPTANVTDRDQLLKTVSSFLGGLGSNQSDIDVNSSTVSYYFVSDGKLIETPDPASATVARVYLVQNSVDKLPVYYPTSDPSILYLTLSSPNTLNVVDANYNHFTPDLGNSSTYPLKTASQAFKDLQDGKGFIVRPTADETVEITDVGLGYYLGNQAGQQYLQPIVVFTGKNNFEAYVSAIAE